MNQQKKQKRIFVAVTNDLVCDNRVHKVACTLLTSGAQVTLIGRIKYDKNPLKQRPYHTKRFRLLFKRGAMFYFEYNFRLFLFLLFNRFNIIVANDLDTLPACFIASRLKYKKLVYDSHEYYTEVPELVNRKFPKKVWLFIEKLFVPHIKLAYTVSGSIADTYNLLYGINIKVIRNVPYCLNNKSENNFTEGKEKVILYQGSLNIGRGLEQLIDAMEFVKGAKLKIIGDGDIKQQLTDRVKNKNLEHKVEIINRIPFDELAYETSRADLGIALEENLGLNYYFALPNKLFDYIQAGVPVLVSPFPEMQKIVRKYDVGTVYEHKSPESLAIKINEIFELKNRYQKWKSNTQKAALDLCWEKEQKELIEIYSEAGLQFAQ
ncbi:MAG TPA: glycosyltransferase [Bacteroidales bacterium]|nr:glycosyltransferase [Bacteroidales bacterium]